MEKPVVRLDDPETIAILEEMAASLDKAKNELMEDRRRTGAYIEEKRRRRALRAYERREE